MPVKPTRAEEKKFWRQGRRLVAGVDEVGKGAWAGPLVTAAVILSENFPVKNIRDSKQLTPKQREKMFVHITTGAISWAVAVADPAAIDRRGIQKVNLALLKEAVRKLHIQPQAVLVDAFPIEIGKKPVKALIRGDAKVVSIAAASIVAKVARDELMRGMHRLYPQYRFDVHKGYGTTLHQELLKKHGPSAIHRMTWSPITGKKKTARRR